METNATDKPVPREINALLSDERLILRETVGTANSIFLERKLSLQAKPTELPSLKNPIRGWRRWQAQVCT